MTILCKFCIEKNRFLVQLFVSCSDSTKLHAKRKGKRFFRRKRHFSQGAAVENKNRKDVEILLAIKRKRHKYEIFLLHSSWNRNKLLASKTSGRDVTHLRGQLSWGRVANKTKNKSRGVVLCESEIMRYVVSSISSWSGLSGGVVCKMCFLSVWINVVLYLRKLYFMDTSLSCFWLFTVFFCTRKDWNCSFLKLSEL